MSGNRVTEYEIRGPQSFGFAIAELRRQRGLTQAEVAEAAGIHRSYLSSLESGTTTTALRRLMYLLAALDVDVVVRQRTGEQRTDKHSASEHPDG